MFGIGVSIGARGQLATAARHETHIILITVGAKLTRTHSRYSLKSAPHSFSYFSLSFSRTPASAPAPAPAFSPSVFASDLALFDPKNPPVDLLDDDGDDDDEEEEVEEEGSEPGAPEAPR